MKNIKAMVAVLAVSVLALVGCERAEAQTLPVDASLYYTDNGVIDKEGVTANLGTEYKNLAVGLTTFTTSDKLETYGAYLAVPIRLQGTKFTVSPTVKVEDYRDMSETVGSVGAKVGFNITDSVKLSGVAMTSRSLSGNSDEVSGETYSVGLTKRF